MLALLLASCNTSQVLAQKDSHMIPNAITIVLQRWWTDEGPKHKKSPFWRKAKVIQMTRKKCYNKLSVLMFGWEYVPITLYGRLQNLYGEGSSWLVTVPIEDSFSGFEAKAIESCIDARNNKILVVYMLPK